MQYRAVAFAVVSFLASGCATSQPIARPYEADIRRVLAAPATPGPRVESPDAFAPQPWKVGQWALYKSTFDGEVGYDKLSVIAIDPCGIWIEHVRQEPDDRWVFRTCFRTSPDGMTSSAGNLLDRVQVEIVQRKAYPPRMIDHRHGGAAKPGTLGVLLAGGWSGSADLPREDVIIPAGHFVAAIHSKMTVSDGDRSAEITGWVHPDVPLGGALKIHAGGGELVLVAYGQTGATSVLPDAFAPTAAPKAPANPRSFLALGVGQGFLTGNGDVRGTRGVLYQVQAGFPLHRTLDVIAETGAVLGGHYSPQPDLFQQPAIFTAGLRWLPFRSTRPRRRLEVSAVYLQADVGLSILTHVRNDTLFSRDEDSSEAAGLVAGGSLGWLPLQGRSYEFGFELRERVIVYTGDAGTRHAFGLMMVAQLHL